MGRDKAERSKPGQPKRGFLSGQMDTGSTSFDWGSVNGGRLSEIVQLVTARGGAIRLGYSRDGNAGSVGVYYGDERDTLYIRPNGDVEETFRIIQEYFEGKPPTGGKSPE